MAVVQIRTVVDRAELAFDDVMSIYESMGWTVQDVLVHADVQRAGVGTALMDAVAQRYAHVRQHVLLTDDEPRQRGFYESLGYAESRDFADGSLRAFVRFG